jgi:multiple antibiotic resistance protein
MNFYFYLNIREIFSAFMVLFAIIDITGSIPIIIDIKNKTGEIEYAKATFVAFGIMLVFFFGGETILKLLGVDISSFAIAGSLVVFFIGLEMVMGIQFFKPDISIGSSIVPIAFPLIAGAGSITSLISIKAEYHSINILIALGLNMVIVYYVLKATKLFEKILGKVGIIILRKVFGIILIAIAIKLFTTNTGIVLGHTR